MRCCISSPSLSPRYAPAQPRRAFQSPPLASLCVRSLTDGYSGSDLKHLCTTAALAPIRELLSTAGAAALARGAEPLSPDALRPLTHADFEAARARTKPSVSTQLDVTKELNKWHRMFAEGAGAKTVTSDAIGF